MINDHTRDGFSFGIFTACLSFMVVETGDRPAGHRLLHVVHAFQTVPCNGLANTYFVLNGFKFCNIGFYIDGWK